MATTDYDSLLSQAATIRDETAEAANTATRVGKLFVDIINQMEDNEDTEEQDLESLKKELTQAIEDAVAAEAKLRETADEQEATDRQQAIKDAVSAEAAARKQAISEIYKIIAEGYVFEGVLTESADVESSEDYSQFYIVIGAGTFTIDGHGAVKTAANTVNILYVPQNGGSLEVKTLDVATATALEQEVSDRKAADAAYKLSGWKYMGYVVAASSLTLPETEGENYFYVLYLDGSDSVELENIKDENGSTIELAGLPFWFLLWNGEGKYWTAYSVDYADYSVVEQEIADRKQADEDLYHSIVPSALAVDYPATLTYGNVQSAYITATLTPDGVKQNVIFLSDNEAVKVAPDGRITIKALGTSEIHVIPTCNTSLAKTILITVESPSLRLTSSRELRLTSSGKLRLT